MKRLRFYFFALIFSVASNAFAQNTGQIGSRKQLQEKCIELKNDQTDSVVARDWSQLYKVANRYIEICGEVWGREWLADAYEKRAIFHQQNLNFKQQVEAADECISIYYGHTGCHLERAQGLIYQRNYKEGRVVLQRLDKLISFEIENQYQKQKIPLSNLDKALVQSKIRELESRQKMVVALFGLLDSIERQPIELR